MKDELQQGVGEIVSDDFVLEVPTLERAFDIIRHHAEKDAIRPADVVHLYNYGRMLVKHFPDLRADLQASDESLAEPIEV